jgi:exonuclease III
MKILTWNCNGAFRRKYKAIEKLGADILVIQECEDPLRTTDENYKAWAKNYLWTGENKNRGLGVFVNEGIMISDLKWETDILKYFLSCRINDNFDLVAVWTTRNNSVTYRYIGQLWKYLQINKAKMTECIIIGDFNSNKIWDERKRTCNHSHVVSELSDIGISSLYHDYYNCNQGQEIHPTFYLQRKINKPYHIDYIFATAELVDKITNFEIGSRDEWLLISDHLPVLCDIINN